MNQRTRLLGEDLDLRVQLVRECGAMARFALAGGKAIPGSAVATIEAASAALEQESARAQAANEAFVSDSGEAPTLSPQTGPQGPERSGLAAASTGGASIRKLAALHERLSQIVAPATPQAILLFGSQNAGSRAGNFLGPVPLVRRMMVAALLSLVLLMGMSLFPQVTGDISFQDAAPVELLLNLLFLLAAAALGASFAGLSLVNRFIVDTNYDPKFEASYWVRFTLGLISGIILAELVPFGEIETAAGGELLSEGNNQGIGRLAKPMLALLGGFSAALVFRILNRFVAAVDTLVRGETREIVAAQEQAAKAHLAEQAAQSRMLTISRLVALQQQIDDGVATEEVKAKIAGILDEFIGADLSTAADEKPGAHQTAPPAPAQGAKTPQREPPGPDSAVDPAETGEQKRAAVG